MKDLIKNWKIIVIGLVIVFMASCATTVPIKSVRSPTIDTSNVKKMGIRGFENRSGTYIGSQLAQYMTDIARQRITATGKFDIVSPNDPNADGVFYGEIRSITSRDDHTTRQAKDKEGNEYTVHTYTREVSVQFVYGVLSKRTDMYIGSVSKQGSTSAYSSESSNLTSTIELAQRIANSQMRNLESDIVPTIVVTYESLMKETSKDKNVKQLMKEADAFVKNGNYNEAIRRYDDIAANYNSIAAQVNAGKIRKAVESDIAARDQMARLDAERGGFTDKAIKNAIDMLYNKLPTGSVIMILKQNNNDRNTINDILDQITRNVVQGQKLKVVDRSNQAIINAEQQFQISGNVDDNSAVSIGKQLGARYAVFCWISGTMSTRKLNIRILDIETSVIVDQSSYDI